MRANDIYLSALSTEELINLREKVSHEVVKRERQVPTFTLHYVVDDKPKYLSGYQGLVAQKTGIYKITIVNGKPEIGVKIIDFGSFLPWAFTLENA